MVLMAMKGRMLEVIITTIPLINLFRRISSIPNSMAKMKNAAPVIQNRKIEIVTAMIVREFWFLGAHLRNRTKARKFTINAKVTLICDSY
jgi:hypothetical protein